MSKRSNQKTQPQKNQKSSSIGQELIIDSEDTYKDLENVFYIHPSHLNMLKSLSKYCGYIIFIIMQLIVITANVFVFLNVIKIRKTTIAS